MSDYIWVFPTIAFFYLLFGMGVGSLAIKASDNYPPKFACCLVWPIVLAMCAFD